MRKFELLVGSVLWMAMSFAIVFAALEPVAVQHMQVAQDLSALCVDGAASATMLCETSIL